MNGINTPGAWTLFIQQSLITPLENHYLAAFRALDSHIKTNKESQQSQ